MREEVYFCLCGGSCGSQPSPGQLWIDGHTVGPASQRLAAVVATCNQGKAGSHDVEGPRRIIAKALENCLVSAIAELIPHVRVCDDKPSVLVAVRQQVDLHRALVRRRKHARRFPEHLCRRFDGGQTEQESRDLMPHARCSRACAVRFKSMSRPVPTASALVLPKPRKGSPSATPCVVAHP